MQAGRTGVCVVTYGSARVLPKLLRGLAEHEPDAPVVIVDDASPDGPPDGRDHEVVALAANKGFSTAANVGARHLFDRDCEYVAFLHPDVRISGPSLTELTRELDDRPAVGIATGPVVGTDGTRIPSAWGPTSIRRALTFAAGLDAARLRAAAGGMLRPRVSTSDASTVVDDMRVEGHVMSGTMLVRRECFEQLDGFDESFFLYWEDADLCYRAREARWEVRLLPCTPFVDAGAKTADTLDDHRWAWFEEGALRFGSKHLVPGQARQLEAALSLGRRVGRLRMRG
ncbi:MAG: glycosyltransferase [Actinobacteria bacterium]|nr:glycosyltransferase [Actinomycetota bacterium]